MKPRYKDEPKPSKELKEQTRIWYKKLKEEGFKDIEYGNVFRSGSPDWRIYGSNTATFGRKMAEAQEFYWVLEVNAYNNTGLPEKVRQYLIGHCDSIHDAKLHKAFVKTMSNPFYLYLYLSRHMEKLIAFARTFKEIEDIAEFGRHYNG